MRARSVIPWAIGSLAILAGAEEFLLTDVPDESVKCEGMYSRRAWGGEQDPIILAKFDPYKPTGDDDPNEDPVVAVAVFEWGDQQYIGIEQPTDDPEISQRRMICDQSAIDQGLCKEEDKFKFLVSERPAQRQKDFILANRAIHLRSKEREAVSYPILNTGYYCILTQPLGPYPYKGGVEFKASYGELPGGQIAKLPFYGGLTIVYAVVGIFWGFLYAQNRFDILPVQNYITAMLGFLVVEMTITWGYYDYTNRHGNNAGSKALMLVASVMNAARNSLSFFLLLIVCMGYGVVKPSLGRTMTWVRYLALAHLVFGVIYAVGSLTVKPEDASPLVLFVVLPLAATGTAFYVWTLNSLGATLKDLTERKQRTKAMMYRKLWWCILGSVLVIFAFFFLNVVIFTGTSTDDYRPVHWQSRWFVLDGWLGIVYLLDVAFISYLWRPTANNRRFAMSEELAQDDEGFDIASLRDSLDDEEEGHRGGTSSISPNLEANGTAKGRSSPLPAPTPQRPGNVRPPRESLDGETIFAVGDEDKLSDEEADEAERAGLTRKHS